jgi:hypothetical protein
MGKRTRNRKRKRPDAAHTAQAWWEPDGVHVLSHGAAPGAEGLAAMTRTFQDQLRQSPLWAQLVAQVGPERAEQLLLQCRVELREGGHAHGGTGPHTRPDL